MNYLILLVSIPSNTKMRASFPLVSQNKGYYISSVKIKSKYASSL